MPACHPGELVLLEVRVDPEPVARDDGDQIRAGRDIGADLRRAVADKAVDRRADFGVAEIEPRGLEIGSAPARPRRRASVIWAASTSAAGAPPPAPARDETTAARAAWSAAKVLLRVLPRPCGGLREGSRSAAAS